MQQGLDQRIRQRAYEIWEALGRPDGDSNQHWLTAERRKKLVRLPRKRRPRTKALAKRNCPCSREEVGCGLNVPAVSISISVDRGRCGLLQVTQLRPDARRSAQLGRLSGHRAFTRSSISRCPTASERRERYRTQPRPHRGLSALVDGGPCPSTLVASADRVSPSKPVRATPQPSRALQGRSGPAQRSSDGSQRTTPLRSPPLRNSFVDRLAPQDWDAGCNA